ncbi:MAG TPA: hypothetical protein VNK05_11335, partial [Chloroflexota bacterium]|nr:hypothetical protein [Chloroflexota bacterium]
MAHLHVRREARKVVSRPPLAGRVHRIARDDEVAGLAQEGQGGDGNADDDGLRQVENDGGQHGHHHRHQGVGEASV